MMDAVIILLAPPLFSAHRVERHGLLPAIVLEQRIPEFEEDGFDARDARARHEVAAAR